MPLLLTQRYPAASRSCRTRRLWSTVFRTRGKLFFAVVALVCVDSSHSLSDFTSRQFLAHGVAAAIFGGHPTSRRCVEVREDIVLPVAGSG